MRKYEVTVRLEGDPALTMACVEAETLGKALKKLGVTKVKLVDNTLAVGYRKGLFSYVIIGVQELHELCSEADLDKHLENYFKE